MKPEEVVTLCDTGAAAILFLHGMNIIPFSPRPIGQFSQLETILFIKRVLENFTFHLK